jgi:hypothetical protein
LNQWWAACERIWSRPTLYEGADHLLSPTSTGDQDAWNAVLMTYVPATAVVPLAADAAPASSDFAHGVEVVDLATLACSFHGRPTQLLHGSGRHKPWDRYGWLLVRRNPYVRMLRRLLCGKDVAVKVPQAAVPIWLRDEREVAVRALDALNAAVWEVVQRPGVFPTARWLVRNIRAASSYVRL